jgi:hypothetical protein
VRTHPVTVTHLVLGLAFLGIAGCWALTEAGIVDARASWLLPLVLVVAGAAGLVASLARGLNRRPDPRLAFDGPAVDAATDPGVEPFGGAPEQDLPDDEEPTRRL